MSDMLKGADPPPAGDSGNPHQKLLLRIYLQILSKIAVWSFWTLPP